MPDAHSLLGHQALLHGLARADLNGQCGDVQSFDATKGRYAVKRLYVPDGESKAPLLRVGPGPGGQLPSF